MKKQLLILIAGLFIFSACQKKENLAEKQANGLHYTFKDYIGPDSYMNVLIKVHLMTLV